MDLVDLNMSHNNHKFINIVEILMDLVDLNDNFNRHT